MFKEQEMRISKKNRSKKTINVNNKVHIYQYRRIKVTIKEFI